jgi:hypothetical protein
MLPVSSLEQLKLDHLWLPDETQQHLFCDPMIFVPHLPCASIHYMIAKSENLFHQISNIYKSRTDQQRVGPIWLTLLRVDYCYLKFSDHNRSITEPAYLHLDRCIRQISSVTLAKPALVYTSIHLTVTTRYSCGDSLRLDSTCGRSGSFKVSK